MKSTFSIISQAILTLAVSTVLLPAKAYAVCPLCTVAVGAGLVFAEKYGIDNTISGIWIGGFTVSLIMWTINWLEGKKIRFKAREIIVGLVYFLLVPFPLYYQNLIGHPNNIIWGMDKLILGMLLGGVLFTLGAESYLRLKEKNNGHAHFPFEKIVLPVGPLIILSLIFYFITRS